MTDPITTKKRILIIEDEKAMREALVNKFQHEGYDTAVATDGSSGLEQALKTSPDLILLDILLPVMDGMTMFKKLRNENEWGKKVPVILLTNLSADDEGINRAIAENEPAYYLVKTDWNLNDVVEKVRERLASTA